jgi:hypothetical protein
MAAYAEKFHGAVPVSIKKKDFPPGKKFVWVRKLTKSERPENVAGRLNSRRKDSERKISYMGFIVAVIYLLLLICFMPLIQPLIWILIASVVVAVMLTVILSGWFHCYCFLKLLLK